MDKSMLNTLRECYHGSREALETALDLAGVTTNANRSEALLEVMGVGGDDKVFYSGVTEEADPDAYHYEVLVGTFFSGVWQPDAV